MLTNVTKVILWRAKYSREAYTDQCGLAHEGYVVLEEVEAKIIDSRIVKGDYSGEENPWQIGYQACSEDGRLFECHWNTWPDTSSSPYWLWYEMYPNRTKIVDEWVNALNCAGLKATPYVQDNQLKIPPLPYCEKHMMCYNETSEDCEWGCYKCEIERRSQEKNSGGRSRG